jgi:hypothetical protein
MVRRRLVTTMCWDEARQSALVAVSSNCNRSALRPEIAGMGRAECSAG